MARFLSKIAGRLLSLQPEHVYLFFPGNISFLADAPSLLVGGGRSGESKVSETSVLDEEGGGVVGQESLVRAI